MPAAIGVATDWTNGAGVFPAGGAISLPASTARQWFYAQNRDVGEVSVAYSGKDTNGNTIQMSPIALNAAPASGFGGGSEEREANVFMPAQGPITITGTAGQKVTILTA